MTKPLYRITKKFIGGLLKGLVITETTAVKFGVGYTCWNPYMSSAYTITKVEEL